LAERRDLEVKYMQSKAIAGTIQMVSHNVRKPSSIARTVMDLLEASKSFEDMQELLSQTKPELDQAFQSINGTLSDLMLAGAEPTLV
jgi:ABC-type transporter Mla maintaining outer membrane lipid asymmetry ATPase subunit MlaF